MFSNSLGDATLKQWRARLRYDSWLRPTMSAAPTALLRRVALLFQFPLRREQDSKKNRKNLAFGAKSRLYGEAKTQAEATAASPPHPCSRFAGTSNVSEHFRGGESLIQGCTLKQYDPWLRPSRPAAAKALLR